MGRSFGKYEGVVREVVAKSFLAEFSEDLQERVLSDALLVDIPSFSTAYREYEPARLVFVLTGLLRVCITSREGRQISIAYGSPGKLLGAPALVGGPVPVRVQAVKDSAVLVLNTTVIEEVGKSEPGFGWRIAEEVGAEFCDLLVSLGDYAFDSVPVRTARHLLSLASPSAANQKLIACVTQRELAESVGSVREVVWRVLHKLQDDGMIEIEPEGIVILDHAKLKAMARHV